MKFRTRQVKWEAFSRLVAVIALIASTAAVQATSTPLRRYALVIGESAYDGNALLVTPASDATDVATALRDLQFTVDLRTNLQRDEMRAAIGDFGAKLSQDVVGVFYFAGHGLQLYQQNYLVPIGTGQVGAATVAEKLVKVQDVFEGISAAGSPFNMVIIDACRTNPLKDPEGAPIGGWVPGLAEPASPPPGAIIAYSTGFDREAADFGYGKNSPYTRALLANIGEPGLSIDDMLAKVGAMVKVMTETQIPWNNSSRTLPFMFRDPVALQGRINDADDDVMVLTDSGTFQSASLIGDKMFAINLKPGSNTLTVMVYNKDSFSDIFHTVTEGWRYDLVATAPGGTQLIHFHGDESHPEAHGPHHGRWFMAARAIINVDAKSGGVSLVASEPEIWRTDFSSLGNNGPDAAYTALTWCVWRTGVRAFDDTIPGNLRPVEQVKSECVGAHASDPRAQELVSGIGADDVRSFLEKFRQGMLAGDHDVVGSIGWLADHEGMKAEIQGLVSRKDFGGIRALYWRGQHHNPDVRNLLAALSNSDLEQVADKATR